MMRRLPASKGLWRMRDVTLKRRHLTLMIRWNSAMFIGNLRVASLSPSASCFRRPSSRINETAYVNSDPRRVSLIWSYSSSGMVAADYNQSPLTARSPTPGLRKLFMNPRPSLLRTGFRLQVREGRWFIPSKVRYRPGILPSCVVPAVPCLCGLCSKLHIEMRRWVRVRIVSCKLHSCLLYLPITFFCGH